MGLEPTCPLGQPVLSGPRLPVAPPGHVRHGSPCPAGRQPEQGQAAAASLGWDGGVRVVSETSVLKVSAPASPSPPSPSTASHSAERARSARATSRLLATTIPSIMSASTAPRGRFLSRTDTTGDPLRRRMERSRSGRDGGLAKTGTTRPRKWAARASERAAAPKSSDVIPTRAIVAPGCDNSPILRRSRPPAPCMPINTTRPNRRS